MLSVLEFETRNSPTANLYGWIGGAKFSERLNSAIHRAPNNLSVLTVTDSILKILASTTIFGSAASIAAIGTAFVHAID